MDNLNILILIIEDDKYMNEMLTDILLAEGYEVDSAADVLDAINKLKHNNTKYDLLILDYNLQHPKGINGIDIYEIAKEENPDIKAVMITAFANEKSIKELTISKGIDAFMKKPFNITDLLDTINELTRAHYNNNYQNN